MRPRNAVVTGLRRRPAGCWAARLTGRASTRIAAREIFIRSPGDDWGWFGFWTDKAVSATVQGRNALLP